MHALSVFHEILRVVPYSKEQRSVIEIRAGDKIRFQVGTRPGRRLRTNSATTAADVREERLGLHDDDDASSVRSVRVGGDAMDAYGGTSP